MISKKDIIKMAKNVLHRSHGYSERKVINPHRDWFIGIVLFIVIAVIGGVFNARSYVYYNTLEFTISDNTEPIKGYQRQTAEEAQQIYSSRLDTFNFLANDVPVVIEASTTTVSTTEEGVDEIIDEAFSGDSSEEEFVEPGDLSEDGNLVPLSE